MTACRYGHHSTSLRARLAPIETAPRHNTPPASRRPSFVDLTSRFDLLVTAGVSSASVWDSAFDPHTEAMGMVRCVDAAWMLARARQ